MGGTCNACDGEDRSKAELNFDREDTTPKLPVESVTVADKSAAQAAPATPVDPIADKTKADGRKIINGISDYIGSH